MGLLLILNYMSPPQKAKNPGYVLMAVPTETNWVKQSILKPIFRTLMNTNR